jgi:hypothetical protein
MHTLPPVAPLIDVCACMYVCICVCMYVYVLYLEPHSPIHFNVFVMYMCVCSSGFHPISWCSTHIFVFMYKCLCAYMHVAVYMHALHYMHICMHVCPAS